MRLVWDCETNSFLDTLTTIHCIAIRDLDNVDQVWSYGPDKIDDALAHLQQADVWVGHNLLCFDIPAVQKLYPDFSTEGIKVIDTLVLSRLLESDLRNKDWDQGYTDEQMPKQLRGRHSLEAWGYRLGENKGSFGKTTDWSEWSEEMEAYCRQDTMVTARIWSALAPDDWSQDAIDFEHRIAEICNRIGNAGWTFDIQAATALYAQLALERDTLEEELQDLFPSWTVETEFVPKANNAKLGYVKGEPTVKSREVVFNPASRKHIERCLRNKYDWKPIEFTPSGEAKLSEAILAKLPYPEAQKLARSFMLQKRLGQLSDGNAGWLRMVDEDGKLRHTINPMGTVTGRASHFGPNLGQVPAVRAEYGKECRQLFTAQPGYDLVGADLSGIELRVLAEFLQDDGAYAEQIVNGDIHQTNADRMGVDRSTAKAAQYALCYGSGDARLGQMVGAGAVEGKRLREAFYAANPAFAHLVRQVKKAAKRGFLYGLDKRRIPVRSEHAALNTLIQGAASCIAKKWVELVDTEINRRGIDANILAFVHDEIQTEVKGDPHGTGDLICRLAEDAGRHFGFRKIPIVAEFSVGRTWADTH